MEIEQINKISNLIEEIGEQRLEELEDLYSRIASLIKEFEERPNKYVNRVELIKQLDKIARKIQKSKLSAEDIVTFDLALSYLKKWRFLSAKDALLEIEPNVGLRSKRKELIDNYKREFHKLEGRQSTLREEILRLEKLMEYPDVDEGEIALQKERLLSYNETISEILNDFVLKNDSRVVIKTCLDALYYPELQFPRPYDLNTAYEMYEFLCNEEIGKEPICKILEYYRYSKDRLSHYLSKPTLFKDVLESNVAWLESINELGKKDAAKISFGENKNTLIMRIPRIISFTSKISKTSKLEPLAVKEVIEYLMSLRKFIASGRYDIIRKYEELRNICSQEEIQKIKDKSIKKEVESLKKRLEEEINRLEKLPKPSEFS